MSIIERIQQQLDNDNNTVDVFVDLKNVFDTVD